MASVHTRFPEWVLVTSVVCSLCLTGTRYFGPPQEVRLQQFLDYLLLSGVGLAIVALLVTLHNAIERNRHD